MTYPAIGSYGADSLAYDPFWQQYMMMQQYGQGGNPSFQGAQNFSGGINTAAASQLTLPQVGSTVVNTVPKVASEEPKEEGSTLGTVLKAGAAIAAVGVTACFFKGRTPGTSKGVVDTIKAGWKSFFGKSAAKETVKLVDIGGGKRVLNVPGKTQILEGANMATEAKNLGLNVDSLLKYTDDAAQIKGYHLEFEHGGKWNRIFVENGQVTGAYNIGTRGGKALKDNMYSIEEACKDASFKNFLEKAMEAVKAKNLSKCPKGIEVNNIVYTSNIEGGTAEYIYKAYKAKGARVKDGLRTIKTDRFALDSEHAMAARRNYPGLDEAIKAAEKGNYSQWSVTTGEYVPQKIKRGVSKGIIDGWNSSDVILLENGAISGIRRNGQVFKPGSTEFDAVAFKHANIFENIFEHQKYFTNVTHSLAA